MVINAVQSTFEFKKCHWLMFSTHVPCRVACETFQKNLYYWYEAIVYSF